MQISKYVDIDDLALLSAYLGALISLALLTLSNLAPDNFWYPARNWLIAFLIGSQVILMGIVILFVHKTRKREMIKEYQILEFERKQQEIKNK